MSANILAKEKHDALIRAVMPTLFLEQIPLADGTASDYEIKFDIQWELDSTQPSAPAPAVGSYQLKGTIYEQSTQLQIDTYQQPIEDSDIAKYANGSNTIDGLLADRSVSTVYDLQGAVGEALLQQIPSVDLSAVETVWPRKHTPQLAAYTPQSFFDKNGNLATTNFSTGIKRAKGFKIPDELSVFAPKHIVVNQKVMRRVENYVLDGSAATAVIGPTGSGKSLHARWLADKLKDYGYASKIIDANARMDGSTLFFREDFDDKGTFVLEGSLVKFARETKAKDLRGVVILEEYNAFDDKTRREFYRLFSDTDRMYEIQSTKGTDTIVDFSHIQFLITANPLTEAYIQDDLRPLSQAEGRRITTVFLGYPTDGRVLQKLFKTIIEAKPNFKTLKVPPNYGNAVKLFKLIHATDSSNQSLGFDAGYSPVAACAFWAAVDGNTAEAWITAIDDNIITKITDITVRNTIVARIQAKMAITIPPELVSQGV